MSSNVIPSAPQEEPSLYPQLPQHDFRMQKANDVSASLNAEIAHYRTVAKTGQKGSQLERHRLRRVFNFAFECESCLRSVSNWPSGCNSARWRQWSICCCFFGPDIRQQEA